MGIFGNPQYALEHGSVCSIAISSDNTYMVAGHSLGSVIVWNVSKPNAPSRIIPPITKDVALSGRKLGHIRGSAVLNVGFVGIKRAEVVSADDQVNNSLFIQGNHVHLTVLCSGGRSGINAISVYLLQY